MTAPLFILQYTCFVVSALMALMLACSRFQQSDTGRRYETSRLLLLASMALLALHYFLQMRYGIRETSDDMGMLVNVLFYAPVAFLMSCSIVTMESDAVRCRRYIAAGATGCLAIVSVFALWKCFGGEAHLGTVKTLLHVLFVVAMAYFIAAPVHEIRRNRRRIVDETGGDISPYMRYTWSSYVMLSLTSLSLVFGIMWRPLLFAIAPLMLLALFLFILSYVALGYGLAPVAGVLPGISAVAEASSEQDGACADGGEAAADGETLTAARTEEIGQALDAWRMAGGFRDNTINMVKLSREITMSKADLSAYFEQYLHSTFRVWLSDIRLGEAQKLITEHPEYSNDTISALCGFSSRSQLYRIFSDKTGVSPREWRELHGRPEQ